MAPDDATAEAASDVAADAAIDAEVVVVGAGVVGMAVAALLATRLAAGRTTGSTASGSLLVVERHESYGRETTSHNSGVVHAGLYYPTGSLKHRACLEGNAALYEWCAERNVPIRRCGKLLVAIEESELESLERLAARVAENEVPGCAMLTGQEARALEPAVPALAALRSDSSGVVDALALTRSLEAEARSHGALIAYQHEVVRAGRDGAGFRIELRDADGTTSELRCAALVNAAGHGAPALAASLGYPLDGAEGVPVLRQGVNRGRWYDVVDSELAGSVRRLIYPVPEHTAGGLGVHLTIDIDGALHFGPDTEWLDDDAPLDYRTDDSARAKFLAAGQRLLPALRDEHLVPGQVGYRTKLQRPGDDIADFLIWHDRGYVHLGGIESPGLTAALPLARRVAELLR